MLSCMSKYRVISVQISNLKLYLGIWRLSEASQVQCRYRIPILIWLYKCLKYRFNRVKISILISKINLANVRLLEVVRGSWRLSMYRKQGGNLYALISKSKVIFGHLETAGGCHRPARYSTEIQIKHYIIWIHT